MKKLKNISLMVFSVFVFIFSAVIFTGCKDDRDYSKLYVFATEGGHVQINNSDNYIEFGDEGSKVFNFEEDTLVKLKAVPQTGYVFVKWECTEDFDDAEYLTQPEINIVMEDDEIVIKAVFEISGATSYTVSYPTAMTGYSIVAESGYSTTVALGGEFKFKVNLEEGYSNSNVVVKVNGEEIKADGNGVYTITNITGNKAITVEGVVANTPDEDPTPATYTISTNDDKFTIIPKGNDATCVVNSGESFTFIITLNEGYKFGAEVVVKANGVIVNASNGQYTIDNVVEDIEIKVEGIEQIVKYTVTIPTSADYEIVKTDGSGFDGTAVEVEEGTTFKFKVNTTAEIESVKADNSVLTASNGVYSVVVNTNISITVMINQAVQMISYEFALQFEEEELGDAIQDIPETISFEIADNKRVNTGYDADMFMVETSFNSEISINQLILDINECLSGFGYGDIQYFAINGTKFIEVVNGKVLVYWDLLADEGGSFTLTIVI